MGSKTSQIQNLQTQMTEKVEWGSEQQYTETEDIYCCFGAIHCKKKQKKELVWKDNYTNNCYKLRQFYQWPQKLLQVIKNKKYPRTNQININNINELANVHQQYQQQQENEEQLLTPQEIDQFKHKLRNSVLVSFAQTNVNRRPTRIQASMICYPQTKITDKPSNQPFRMSLIHKTTQNQNVVPKNTLRLSIISFVDQTISSVMGQNNIKQIPRKSANSLTYFLHFSVALQEHMNSCGHLLYQVRKTFSNYLKQTYSNAVLAGQQIQTVVSHIKQFVLFLRELVFDFYELSSKIDELYSLVVNEDNLMTIVYSILFKEKQLYNITFNAFIYHNDELQRKFNNTLTNIQQCQPEHFDVQHQYCLNRLTIDKAVKNLSLGSQKEYLYEVSYQSLQYVQKIPYSKCISILKGLKNSHSAIGKMKVIMQCAGHISTQIKTFYAQNCLEMRDFVLDADQILSIFCYIICKAKIPHLHSHIQFLENFSTQYQLISAPGYYFSVLNCALEQIQEKYMKN